jgi:hypothetical protein
VKIGVGVFTHTKHKPHIRLFDDDIKWYCEFMRKDDSIVQSGFGETPQQAYKECINNVDSITSGNALLNKIKLKYGQTN